MLSKLWNAKLPLILFAEVLVCLIFGDMVPVEVKSFLYSVSLSMKEILLWVLPLIIFSFVISSLCNLKQGALSFVILLFSMICLSNFFTTCMSGFFGTMAFKHLDIVPNLLKASSELDPQWVLSLPKLIPNEAALGAGLILGLVFALFSIQKGKDMAGFLQKASVLALNKIFIPVVPVFLAGFLLKLQHDQLLMIIIKNYFSIFLIISLFVISYLALMYGLVSNFDPRKWLASIRNMLPAMLAGFSSMSSAAALPLVIYGSEKNCKEKSIVQGVIPVTTNIHLVGDCIGIPIMALAILLSFGGDLPSFSDYLIFASFFVLAKFAVAAVPGGGILVMLPILEKYLGFSGEMLSLITMLYMMFDPVLTASNVMGNGSFVMLISKLMGRQKAFRAIVGER